MCSAASMAHAAVPTPWLARDVGAPSPAGASTYNSGTFTITASGVDIWGTSDQFHFVYQQLSGDVDVVARVDSLATTHSWAKAGIMVRESLAANSRHAFALVSAANGYGFQRRIDTGGYSTFTSGGSGAAPGWVRLVRTGHKFEAYRSSDGTTWTLMGSDTVAMADQVYIGLAVTSHNATLGTTAKVDNLKITSSSSTNQPPTVSLTSPTAGATFTAPATIALTATASDPENRLSHVDFYAGTTLLSSATTQPYSFSWSSVPAGTYALTAVATDADGGKTTSTAVSVTVGGQTPSDGQPPTTPATLTATAAIKPELAKLHKAKGERVPDRYLVVLDDAQVDAGSVAGLADALTGRHRGQRRKLYQSALRGFAVRMTEADALLLSEDPRVAFVEEDAIVRVSATQTSPPNWGLDRIDQRNRPLNGLYNYSSQGTGVNAYVIDTGIGISHPDFEGRAAFAFDAVGDGQPPGTDCVGHGTHVAGIVGSETYGVAKNVNIFSVRAIGCDSLGYLEDVIEAIDWVTAHHVKPAVVNASLGGGTSLSVNAAIANLVAAGVTYVGAAGNNSWDACNDTPGSAAEAITVGNVDTDSDTPFSNSNYGPCVDIWAPGSAITSTTRGGFTSEMWGTSMAAPHVAGAVALYLQRVPTATPAQVRARLLDGATSGVLTGLTSDSPNKLLYTPAMDDTVAPTVTLTSPANSATVSGTVTLSATATDDVAVSMVRFYVDGAVVGSDSSSPYSFSWSSTAVGNGSHSIKARALDTSNNYRDSATATVTVSNGGDTTQPSVSLTAPAAGATLSGTVTLSATASDNVALARVEFLVDGAVVATDTTASYSASWNSASVASGSHSVAARAVDSSGNSRTTAAVSVTVSNTATLPSPWVRADVGAVGIARKSSYANGVYTLEGAGRDVSSTADAFHFVYRTWSGDGDLVVRVASLTAPSGSPWAQAGIMFRENTTASSRHVALLASTDGKVKFRRRTTTGGSTVSEGPSAGSNPVPRWLKITRRGSVFTAYLSSGSSWTQVGASQTLSLPSSVLVGMWTLRSGTTGLSRATFTNLALSAPATALPAGWGDADVGATGATGSTQYASGKFTVKAGGTELWGSADAFRYVYRSLSGDGSIIVHAATITKPSDVSYGLAAVMIRETLTADSKHASMLITTSGKAKFRRRTAVGGTTYSDGPSEGTTFLPRWLKLVRAGDAFTAYISSDGSSWTQIHTPQTVPMNASVYVGIATLRNGGSSLTQATYDSVSVVD
jgi:subtilisin family serine protease/regulation of enolase protein 1 (concanavalin A-like superfamily)